VPAVEVVDRAEREALAALGDQPLAQLRQGDVWHGFDRLHEEVGLRFDPPRPPVAAARLRRRPAGPQILVHPAHRARDADAEPPRRRVARHASLHRPDHPDAKVCGKILSHACWPPSQHAV